MPYFINCPRCNEDNSYSVLQYNACKKCSGTGRDWRDDHELDGYHSWANVSISMLKDEGKYSLEHEGKTIHFTYRDEIPECTIEEEIEEIKKELDIPEPEYVSQIFCQHKWAKALALENQKCVFCGKEKSVAAEHDIKTAEFKYNKKLHDTDTYFPNRCYACHEYEKTTSEHGNPTSGSDIVFCNIGGAVRADEGCKDFSPDVTAECDSCWNFSRNKDGAEYHCDIQGQLTNMIWGRCQYHVEKEDID